MNECPIYFQSYEDVETGNVWLERIYGRWVHEHCMDYEILVAGRGGVLFVCFESWCNLLMFAEKQSEYNASFVTLLLCVFTGQEYYNTGVISVGCSYPPIPLLSGSFVIL